MIIQSRIGKKLSEKTTPHHDVTKQKNTNASLRRKATAE
jgi:hypothetical protein